jgi:hypothetical protein
MKKTMRIIGLVLGVAFLSAQFVRPAKTNPASDPALSAFAHLDTPPAVAARIKQSCGDCHSNDTRWPWYTNVAPVSWWTIDHVNHGRSHVNFSEWGKLPPADAAKLLEEICEEIEAQSMPLPPYLWIHRDARLSPDDRRSVCLWTVEQRNKLTGKPAEHSEHK